MTSDQHLSFGQRVYRALFKVFGPADVGPAGPPTVLNPNDKTVPLGHHLETITDSNGIRRRIAVQNQPAKNQPSQNTPGQNKPAENPTNPV